MRLLTNYTRRHFFNKAATNTAAKAGESLRNESNPKVYFTIARNGNNIGKMTFEVNINNFNH